MFENEKLFEYLLKKKKNKEHCFVENKIMVNVNLFETVFQKCFSHACTETTAS